MYCTESALAGAVYPVLRVWTGLSMKANTTVLGSGKIEQFLNSKSQMLKLRNPVFSPFMLLQ